MILSSDSYFGKNTDEDETKKKRFPFHTHQPVFHTPKLKDASLFFTAPTGAGGDEKRSSKQGEVKGQGLGRGKARTRGLPPRCALGE